MGGRAKTYILAGDIGGTKTNLGLFKRGKNRPHLKIFRSFSSKESPDLETNIERFLGEYPCRIFSACFGIAGPVVKGVSKTTNLPWTVSEDKIKRRFGWDRISIINDLTATAMAIPLLRGRELTPLNNARPGGLKNIALVAPGTGLGEALLIFQDGIFTPVSSEGGHADFSPSNEEEIDLWRFLHRQWGHVSMERLLSGPGLVNIYHWLKASGRYKEPAYLKRMTGKMDPARAITQAALERKNPLCEKVLDIFVSALGAESGNLALKGMTTKGVYLGGGIPPKILPKLKQGLFMKSFTNKGRFKGLLEKIPVKVIMNDKAALLGSAYCASAGS